MALYGIVSAKNKSPKGFIAIAVIVCGLVLAVPFSVSACWPEVGYSFTTTWGLLLDVAGVTLLFYYGMPPRTPPIRGVVEPYTEFATVEGLEDQFPPTQEEADALTEWTRRNRRVAAFGFVLVILGFMLQAVASWMV